MDTFKSIFEALMNSPHYAFGWLFLAILTILPAIVSANLIQHELSKVFNRKEGEKLDLNALIKNIFILLIAISIIAYAYYLYAWK